jgi:siroheme synthase
MLRLAYIDHAQLHMPMLAILQVLLMAAKTFPVIVEKLLKSGWSPDTPVCVVHAVGRPEQASVASTLALMAADPTRIVAESPCIIIVGGVAKGFDSVDL